MATTTNITPNRGEVTGVNPTLEAQISSPLNSTVDVEFYNARNENLIGTDTINNASDGDIASVTWDNLPGKRVKVFYSVVVDGAENIRSQENTTFFTSLPLSFDNSQNIRTITVNGDRINDFELSENIAQVSDVVAVGDKNITTTIGGDEIKLGKQSNVSSITGLTSISTVNYSGSGKSLSPTMSLEEGRALIPFDANNNPSGMILLDQVGNEFQSIIDVGGEADVGPLYHRDKLFYPETNAAATVSAYEHRGTTSKIWETDTTVNTNETGLVRGVAAGSGNVFVSYISENLVALSQNNGSIQWRVNTSNIQNSTETDFRTVTHFNGLVYLHIDIVDSSGNDDRRMLGINPADGSINFNISLPGEFGFLGPRSSITHSDTSVISLSGDFITSINQDGTTNWQKDISSTVTASVANLSASRNALFVTDRSELTCIDLSDRSIVFDIGIDGITGFSEDNLTPTHAVERGGRLYVLYKGSFFEVFNIDGFTPK